VAGDVIEFFKTLNITGTWQINGVEVTATAAALNAAVVGAEDVIACDADVVLTHADVVLTHADAVSTAADAVSTAADAASTAQDAIDTAADAVSTANDAIATAADAASTAQDAIDTAADAVSTANDAIATAGDAVATAADRVQTGIDAAAAAISAAEAQATIPLYEAQLESVLMACTLTENGAGAYTAALTVPAGYSVLEVGYYSDVLWNAATSAVMIIGDGADPDGYMTSTDLKAVQAVTRLSEAASVGAYGSAPKVYAAEGTISFVATSVGAGTAGRTMGYVRAVKTANVVVATKV
jgi:uncharacterized phage infection (PIP) family protein YhgE